MEYMDRDFIELWLADDKSQAVENMEKRKQKEVVRYKRLPIKANEHSVPSEVRYENMNNDDEFEIRRKCIDSNIAKWTKEQYEKMGIIVVDEYDELFYNVQLPDGWEIKPTEHSMWNDVVDNNGNRRISFFYKGSFYDMDAFSNFLNRYTVREMPFDEYKSNASYEERKQNDWYGIAYDCEKEIYRTEPMRNLEYGDRVLVDKAIKFLDENHPMWQNFHAYWK